MAQFNILTQELPNEIVINDTVYQINCDHKSILRILALYNDDIFTPQEQRGIALNIFYPEIPDDVEKAYEQLQLFIRMYADEENGKESGEISKPTVDYQQDGVYIYSAFFQLYGIDLTQTNLHWFVFQYLLSCINDGTPQLYTLREIRSKKISPNMTATQRTELAKLQQRYAIKSHARPKSSVRAKAEALQRQNRKRGGGVNGTI